MALDSAIELISQRSSSTSANNSYIFTSKCNEIDQYLQEHQDKLKKKSVNAKRYYLMVSISKKSPYPPQLNSTITHFLTKKNHVDKNPPF
ncbi:hypothetical protein Hanom_Chr08g00756141 [Helianthus anomalus]